MVFWSEYGEQQYTKQEVFTMGKVIAVCISKEKGTQKYRIPEGEFIEEWGLKDDAHAGK